MSDSSTKPETTNSVYSDTEILVVDDQKASRILLRAFLTRIGVGRVDEAKDGIEALRVLMGSGRNNSPFDLVFVSRKMKEMNGLDLVRTLRKVAGGSEVPVIIVSEDLDPAFAKDAATAGATEYMLRPYTEEDLRALLKKVTRI